jgi:hypothetical protein
VHLHGTELQQSVLAAHSCPYSEQTNVAPPSPTTPPAAETPPEPALPPWLGSELVDPPALPAPPELPAPPVPEVDAVPHVPEVDPRARMQVAPGQQSPFIVQEPPTLMQASGEQTRTPSGVVTQGTPLQQSDEEAQVSPAAWQLLVSRPLQRGMPSESRLHAPDLLPCPPQQLAEAEETLQA